MSHNWGYAAGKKMAKDMGLNLDNKVAVKSHTRAPRSPKVEPPAAAPASKDIPQNRTKKTKG